MLNELVEDLAPPVAAPIAELATTLGLSLQDVSRLLQAGTGEGLLRVSLLKLKARLERDDLEPVGSRLSYLASVMSDAKRFVAEEPVPPIVEAAAPPAWPLAAAAGPAATAVASVPYKERRRAEIKARFSTLSKEEQQPFALMASESLKAARMLHPSIARAIYAQDWLKNGLLLSKMVEAYAVATCGADWATEPATD